jgi:hypothetical protein
MLYQCRMDEEGPNGEEDCRHLKLQHEPGFSVQQPCPLITQTCVGDQNLEQGGRLGPLEDY